MAATNAGSVAAPASTSTIDGTTTIAAEGASADTDWASTSAKLSRRRRSPATGDCGGSRSTRVITLPPSMGPERSQRGCPRPDSRMEKSVTAVSRSM